jgi:hypothetical protein
MLLKYRMVSFRAALCALVVSLASISYAGTIIKLNLGGVGPDIQMGANGILSTVDQTAGPPPTGDQLTNIEYTDFLNFIPNVNTNVASFSLSGLQRDAGGAQLTFGLAIQGFHGGTFSLYDASDNLLLTGPVVTAALAGVTAPPGTGSLFTTSLGSVTGGSLAGLIQPGSVSISMNLGTVNGGLGFSTLPGAGGINVLQPFQADASALISANAIPEPASLTLVLAAGIFGGSIGRRRIR